MRLSYYFRRRIHFIASFLGPIGILGLVYAVFGMFPFGDKTVLISDMEGQYVDFYSAFFDILTDGRSLFYSWEAGMGHNFIGILAYYLSSPFSLLVVFFDKDYLTESLLIITLLKVGSAGFTFSLYLNYMPSRSRVLVLLFSVLYALTAYSVVYSYNIMWLDGVIFLPLVLLGVERIIREDRFLLFSVSLAVMIIANFYIAYMAGLFSFLYFLVSYFANHPLRDDKVFIKKLLTYTLAAVLSAGSTAFLMLPTFYTLQNNQGVALSPLQAGVNFSFFDLFSKAIPGGYDTLKDGLPNIYSGLLPLITGTLYFLNRKIPKKERILFFLLILFLVLSLYFSYLNLMWHAFDHPNWFPYRYSFLFSFLLISLAYKGAVHFDKQQITHLFAVTGIWVLVIAVIQKQKYSYLSDWMLILSILFLIIYAFLLYLYTYINRRKLLSVFLSGVILAEISLSTWLLITSLDKEFKYQSRDSYISSLNRLDSLIAEARAKDDTFYRLERKRGLERSLNDGLNLNYRGIAFFNSMINLGLVNFMNKTGFLTPVYMSVNYCGSTLVTDSLFSVKYVLSNREQGYGYKEISQTGDITIYENTNVLPLCFLADRDLLNLRLEGDNPFVIQNELLNLALNDGRGIIQYFKPLPVLEETLTNVSVSYEAGKTIYKKADSDEPASVEYKIGGTRNQEIYTYILQDGYSYVDVYINDKFLENYLHFYNCKILDLGFSGDKQTVRMKLAMNMDSFTIRDRLIYGLDIEEYEKAIGKLQADTIRDLQVTDTTVTGRVNSENDSLLFTSIPFDPGWSAVVDGETVEITPIAGAFVGVQLSEGEHEVFLRFVPVGFRSGVVISVLSILTGIYILINRRYFDPG